MSDLLKRLENVLPKKRELVLSMEQTESGLLGEWEYNFDSNFIAARTDTEKILANIWADVLRLEQVGINDNFFEVGGDSILTIQFEDIDLSLTVG